MGVVSRFDKYRLKGERRSGVMFEETIDARMEVESIKEARRYDGSCRTREEGQMEGTNARATSSLQEQWGPPAPFGAQGP